MAAKQTRTGANSEAEMGRHKGLLTNSKVSAWYAERALRSRLSADESVRKLGFILEFLGWSPDELIETTRKTPDELRARLVAYAGMQKKRGRLDTYVLKSFDGLRSFLEYSHVEFHGFPKLSPMRGESLAAERVPTPEELGQILDRLSLRGRVSVLLMAHSGLRPGAIGSYGGEDGLRLRDIPELQLGIPPKFSIQPFMIRVPAALSKTRVAYTTFGSSQLASSLLSYLAQRRERGEKLTMASPVVGPAETRGIARQSQAAARFGEGFLTPKAIVEEIRGALRETVPKGVTWRPYVLRAYCSTRLMLAEGSGKISRDLREAILGHDGGVAARYNVGKRWGEDILKEARAAYKRCENFLSSTGSPQNTAEEIQREAAVLLLTGLKGKTEADARRLVEGKTGPELADLLKSSVKPREQAVPVEDVKMLLDSGWEFVSPLNGSMAVLRPPFGEFSRQVRP
jgi:integrase